MSNFSRSTPQAERSRPQSYAQQDSWNEQLPAPPKLGQSAQDRLGVLPSPANESFDVSENEDSRSNEDRDINEETDHRSSSIIKHSSPVEADSHSTKQLPNAPEIKTQPPISLQQNAPTMVVRNEGETGDVSPIEPATRHSLKLVNRDTSHLDPSTAHHADQSHYPDSSNEEPDISPVVSNLSRNISLEQRQLLMPHIEEPDSAARDNDDPLMRHIGNGDISPVEPSKDDTADSLPLARTMSGRPISSVHFAGGLIMPSAKPPQILETVEPKSEPPVSQATNTFDSPTLRSAKLAVPGRTDTPESLGHSSAAESEAVVSQAEAIRTERVGSALEVEANSPIEGKRNPFDSVDQVKESTQDESIVHATIQAEKSTALGKNDSDETETEDHTHAQSPAVNASLQLPTDDDDLYAEPSYMPRQIAAAQDPVKVPSPEGISSGEMPDNKPTTQENLSSPQQQHEQQVAQHRQHPSASTHLPVEIDTMHTRQPSQVSSLHEPRTPPSTQADRLREQQPIHHRQFSFESQGSPGQQRLIQQSGVMTQQRPPSFVAMPRDQYGRPVQEMISTGRGQPMPQQEQVQARQPQEQVVFPPQQHEASDPRLTSRGNQQHPDSQGASASQAFRDAGPGVREVNQEPPNEEHNRGAYDPRTGRDEFSLPGVGPPSALQQPQGRSRGRGSVLQSISSRVSSTPPVQNPPGPVNSRIDPRRVAPQYDRQFSFQSSDGGASVVGSRGESQQAPEEKESKRRSGFFRSLSRPGSMSSSSEASTRAQAAVSRVDLGSSQSPRPAGQLSRPPSGNNRLTKQAPETQVQRAASSGVADQGKNKRFSSLKAIFGRAGTTGHTATPKANKLSKVEPSASVRKRQGQEQAQQWQQSVRQQSARQPYHQLPPTGAYAATSGYNPVPTPPATEQRSDAFSGYKQPSSALISTGGTQPSGQLRSLSPSTQPTTWPLQQQPDTTVIREQGGMPPPPGGYYAPGTTEGVAAAAAAATPAPARANGFSHQRGASGHAAIEQLQTRRDSSPYESMVQMQNRPSIHQRINSPEREPNYEQPAIPAAYLDRAAQSAQLQSYWGRQYNPSLPSSPVHYPPPAQTIPMQQQQRAQSPPNPAYPPHAPIYQYQQQYPPRRESVQSFGNPMSPQISNPTLAPGHRYSQDSRAHSAEGSSIHSPVSPYSQRGPISEPMPPPFPQQQPAIPRPQQQQQQQQYQQPPPRVGPISGGVNADRNRRIHQHQERPWAITLPTETFDERTEAELRYEEAKESAMYRSPHSPKPPMDFPPPVQPQASQNQSFPAQRYSQQFQQQSPPQDPQQTPQRPSQQPSAGYREAPPQIQPAAAQGYKEIEPQESPQDHISSPDSLRAPPSQQSTIHSPQPQQYSAQRPPPQQHLSPLQTQQGPQQAANHRTSLTPHSQHSSPHDSAATRRQSQSPHFQNPPSPAYLAHLEQTQKFPGKPPVPSGQPSPHHLPPVDTNTSRSPSTVPLPASANSASPYSANAANVQAPPPPQLSTRNLAAISHPSNYNAASPHAVRQAHASIPQQQHPGRRSNPASPTSPSQQSTSTSYPSTEPPAYTGPNANPIAENDDDLYAVDSPVSDRRPGGTASRTRPIEDDDAPVMMGASYPGDEWVPEWDGRD